MGPLDAADEDLTWLCLVLKRIENRGGSEESRVMQSLKKTLKKALQNSVCIHSEDYYYGQFYMVMNVVLACKHRAIWPASIEFLTRAESCHVWLTEV